MKKHRHLLILTLGLVFSAALFADYYDDLGLQKNASFEEIKAAHRKAVKIYHPDITKLPKAEAAAKFMKVQEAFEHFQAIEDKKNGWGQGNDEERVNTRTPEENQKAARDKAVSDLEEAWRTDTFGASSIGKLPERMRREDPTRKNKARINGPRDVGEWEGVVDFMNSHLGAYLATHPSFSQVDRLMGALRESKFSGPKSFGIVATTLNSELHRYQLDAARSESEFAAAVVSRLGDYESLEEIQQYEYPSLTFKSKLGELVEKFISRFGTRTSRGEKEPVIRFIDAVLDHASEVTTNSEMGYRDLERVIHYLVKVIEPVETKLKLLGEIGVSLDKGFIKPLRDSSTKRVEAMLEGLVEDTFTEHPELHQKYSKVGGWLGALVPGTSECVRKLGKIARKMGKG